MRALIALPLLALSGCSGCNKSEYDFAPLTDPVIVEPADYGSWLSMGVAPDGQRPTITYYDRIQKGVGFATGTEQADGTLAWVHEYVDGYPEADGLDRGDRGKYTSHAVAPDGRVWVAYQDVDNGTLKVAVRAGPHQWTNEVADVGGGITSFDAGNWASLAIMADGNPIVAHFDGSSETLRVAWLTEAGWQKETAFDAGGRAGEYANVAVSGDTVYIAYYNALQGDLELLEGTPGNWTHTVIDGAGNVGQWPNLHVEGDEVWVAYQDVGEQDLKFARRVAGSWEIERVDTAEYRGADTEVFARDGNPQVVYFDGDLNDQWLASHDGTSWSYRKIAGDGNAVGFHNEVSVVGDKVWVGSYDFTNRTLVISNL